MYWIFIAFLFSILDTSSTKTFLFKPWQTEFGRIQREIPPKNNSRIILFIDRRQPTMSTGNCITCTVNSELALCFLRVATFCQNQDTHQLRFVSEEQNVSSVKEQTYCEETRLRHFFHFENLNKAWWCCKCNQKHSVCNKLQKILLETPFISSYSVTG